MDTHEEEDEKFSPQDPLLGNNANQVQFMTPFQQSQRLNNNLTI